MHTFPAENILLLLAYSFTEDLSTEPCLVYQYMPNGSVSDRLKCTGGSAALTWDQRKDIAFQTAKGLCHLHGNKIVHGDIKSGNILLDSNFKAHIGDFGLARGGPEADQDHKTVSVIIGTDWYLPDDYRRSYDLKYAVDTFCYGMFLFDLVTGKSPSVIDPKTNKHMRDLMLKRSPQEPIVEYVDKNVGYDLWAKFLYCFGKDCTNAIANQRPKMVSVTDALEQLKKGQPQALAMQKFYDEKNKKLDSGPADLMRHEDVKTTSTRKLLPSDKVTGNDNGIPVIPSIINSVTSASGVPNIVANGGIIPDIVCGPMPENNESGFSVRSGFSEDSRTESERSDSEYSESAMTEMSKEMSRELPSASFAIIQEITRLKSGN
jgi:interleukin-1 receptor-associated kinase 1